MPLLQNLTIGSYFADVDDPRIERTKTHALLDISIITICAVICGADGWVAVEAFGIAKRAWRAHLLTLPNGIPSHDPFGRVFARIDPDQFQRGLLAWIQAIQQTRPDVIAIDGKTHRRSHDRATSKAALQLVSAWANNNRLVLGQVATESKSNEIPAIPLLLDLLDLQGATVTIDALGCQTAIAEQIVRRGGTDVLARKGNQPTMLAAVGERFADARTQAPQTAAMAQASAVTAGHGRLETRRTLVISEPTVIA